MLTMTPRVHCAVVNEVVDDSMMYGAAAHNMSVRKVKYQLPTSLGYTTNGVVTLTDDCIPVVEIKYGFYVLGGERKEG